MPGVRKPMHHRILIGILWLTASLWMSGLVHAQRQMDALNRGLVAVRKNSTQIYLSWRLHGNEPPNLGFNLYRSTNGGAATKLNATPITATTDYTDAPGSTNLTNNAYAYFVRPVLNGVEQSASETVSLPAAAQQKQFLTLPLRSDTGPNGPYTVKCCWVGDLDGDGDYDYVVDRLSTLGSYEQFLEAYTNDGTFLWRMAMGPNSLNQYSIEPGSSAISVGDTDNVTVHDLDGDGRAEVCVRTSNGVTVTNAAGNQVVSVTSADTAQFLSVIDGLSGVELGRTPLPNPWAVHGVLTNKAMIAYLDGKRPSVVMYGNNRADTEEFYRVINAFDYRNGTLSLRWTWAMDPNVNPGAEGHQIRVADVDNDGKDEICDLGYTLDDNGTQLFVTPLVHGDRFHIADINPDRPGLETFAIQQNNATMLATAYYESGTGNMIRKWYAGSMVDVGRGIALDINPVHKGYEMYSTQPGIYNAKGQQIYANNVWAPEGLWWDGDLGREFIDGAGSGALSPVINKFNATTGVTDRVWTMYSDWGAYSIGQAYGGRPAFWGDILGDWREELVFIQTDYTALRIYTTTTAATNRLYTLMHNPQYRCQATTKGYVQASYVDYYLGFGMPSAVPPPPMVATDLTWSTGNTWDAGVSTTWKNAVGATVPFAQGNRVLFDLSGSNASSIALTGTLNPASVSFFNPQDFTLNGTAGLLAGSMTLTKSGKGRTTLTGTHPYTGATTIWDGALVINGQLSASPVTVWGGTWGGSLAMGQTGGRLAGTGTVSQPVTLGYRGTITPGPGMGAAGTLQLGSSLTAEDGAVLALDLSNDPSGTTSPSDRIQVAGNLSLSGTVHIVVTALNGTLSPGTYTLLTYGGTLTGSASNIALTLPEGTAHTLNVGSGAITLTVPVTRAPASITWTGGNGGNAWDIAQTANWSRGGTPDTFVSGDSVTFDASGSANPVVTLNHTMPVGGITVSAESNYTLGGSGAISGPGGLVKSGNGVLTLTTTNTFTGPVSITGGTLAVGNLGDGGSPSSIGAAGTAASNLLINGGVLALVGEQTSTNRSLTLGSLGGTISVPASNSLQISGQLTGAGALVKTGAGNLVLAAANTHAGGTFVTEGKLVLASDTANVSGVGGGGLTLNGGTLQMTDNSDTTSWATSSWSIHVPSGAAGRLNADGRCYLSGPLTGGGDFTFYTPYVRTEITGNWSAFTGRIFVIADGDGGDFRFQSSSGYPSAALDLGADVYAYYNRTMSGNLSIPIGNLSGDATSQLRGGLTAGRTVTYQVGARNEDGIFAGVLTNGTGPVALTKTGTGTLTLAGACTHTGPSTVSAGRLRVTGTTSGSAITVQSGGTLGGTGTVTGNVTIQAGGALELGASPLVIAGNLTFAGGAVVRAAPGFTPAPGTYVALTYSGTLSGTPLFSWEPPAGSLLTASFSTATAGQLIVTFAEPPRGPGPITWTGSASFVWDTTTANWTASGQPAIYQTGDSPSFTDAGDATSPVSLPANVSPASVTVDSAKSYTISGVGQITGTASLSKSGAGTLTLSGAHAFDGGTTLHQGVITIGNAASLGTGTVTLNGGTWATVNLSPQNPILVTAPSAISGGDGGGAHAIRNVSGSADLTLVANNVFDLEGDISGFSGTFFLTGIGPFRLFSTTFDGSAAATFDLGTRSLSARQGSAYRIGALAGLAGSSLGMASNNNSSSCTYTVGGKNIDSTFAGVIANGSATKPVHLVKTGSGNLVLSGASTHTGNTTISTGKLTVTGSLAATPTTVAAAGTLSGNGSIAGAVTCHGTLAPGNPAGTLTLSNGLVLSSTAVIEAELGSSSDLIAVTGNLTLDGTLNVTAAPGFSAGTFTLATYTGSLVNNTLNIGSLPAGFAASVNTSTTGQVRLVVTALNSPPQITSGPAAVPAGITIAGGTLVVTATDDAGEGNLSYQWSSNGPAPVSFSPNGNNAAKSTNAVFTASGDYTFSVTVTDAGGLSASGSSVISVSKAAATITLGSLSANYDASPRPVTVHTDPAGLATLVTYDGSSSAPVVPGSYQVSASVQDPQYTGAATGTLVISPRSFSSWEIKSFTPAQILAGESAPDADPDRDGLTNLAEYALGTDPHAFTAQPAVIRDGNSVSMTFQRPAHVDDVIYQVQAGRDFRIWENLTLEVLNPGSDPETVRASKTFPAPPPPSQFLRMRFTMPLLQPAD